MAKGLIKLSLAYRGGVSAPLTDDVFVRTVVVPSEYSLVFLHAVIQESFGWLNYHQFAFIKDGITYDMPESDDIPLEQDEREAARTQIGLLFSKTGEKCSYEYDFGDSNEVEITYKGKVPKYDEKHFEATGPDLIEDSAAFGYTHGIVELLSAKSKTMKARKCIAWIGDAFGLTPEKALAVPSPFEIAERVWKLIDFVQNSIP